MPRSRWMPLPSWSVVTATGRDARAFLQGQLTNDLLALDRHPGLLAAACNRQGRVIAVLRLAARSDAVLMLLPRAMAPLLVAHLSRFVLRSAVVFGDVTDEVVGLLDAPPSLQVDAGRAGIGFLVAGPRRTLLVGARPAVSAVLADVSEAAAEDWEAASIEDGEPAIYPETSGLWLPQMINLDLLAAISFGKGCYLGQEIVARAQHLGRIKRRMLRYAGPPGSQVGPGQMLYAAADPAAQVVRACGEKRNQCLAVVALGDCGELLGAAPSGREFAPADLPYAIPAPAPEEATLPAG